MADGRSASPYVSAARELRLSNPGHLELLRGMAERGAPLRTGVRGLSMSPFIRDGDVVTIAPVGGAGPRVGDVVAFALPGTSRMVVHRVVARAGRAWLVRGDNCAEPDGVASAGDVVGRVVRVERAGRDVRLGLGSHGACVAALSRCDILVRARAVWRAPRRAAARVLQAAQSVAAYRRVGKRLVPRIRVERATSADMGVVQHRLNPGMQLRCEADGSGETRWVARMGGRVVGFVELVHSPADPSPWTGFWLFSLHIWGPYRGLGIGSILTRTVIAEARAQGAEELRLLVGEHDTRAIRCYRGLGFEAVVLDALEPTLVAEKAASGRRRIVMRRSLGDVAGGTRCRVGSRTASDV